MTVTQRNVLASTCRRSWLALRICHDDSAHDVYPVDDDKCTVGSGPRCTVRLRQAGVQPLHCLILSTSAGTIIRRWSLQTLLNGDDFDEAELHHGDRLTLGPVEVEVLLEQQSAPATDASNEQITDDEFEDDDSGTSPRLSTEANDCASPIEVKASLSERAPTLFCDEQDHENRPMQVSVGEDYAAGENHGPKTDSGALREQLSPTVEDIVLELHAANDASRRRVRRILAALRHERGSVRDLEARVNQLQRQLEQLLQGVVAGLENTAANVSFPQAGQPVEQPETPRDKADDDWAGASAADAAQPTSPSEQSSADVTFQPTSRHDAGDDSQLRQNSPKRAPNSTDWEAPEDLAADDAVDGQRPMPPKRLSQEDYAAQLAARMDEFAKLEQQLGLMGDAEKPATNEPPTKFETPPHEVWAAPSHDESQPREEAETPPGEYESEADVSPATSFASVPNVPDLSGSASGGLDEHAESSAAVEELRSSTPDELPTTSGSATDAASFWGFDAKPARVDDDLLGPLPLSSRTSTRLNSPVPPDVVEQQNADLNVDISGPYTSTIQAATAEIPPADQPPIPAPEASSMVSDGQPPSAPGLSDSALAHLKELDIWKDDRAEQNAGVPAESTSIEVEATDGPAGASPAIEDFSTEDPHDQPASAQAAEGLLDRLVSLAEQSHEELTGLPADTTQDSAPDSTEVMLESPASGASEEAASATEVPLDSPHEGQQPAVLPGAAEELPSAATVEQSTSAPTSFIDRYRHLLDEDDHEDRDGGPTGTSSATELERAAIPATSPKLAPNSSLDDEEDDQSLDSYMVKLMQRVRGESPGRASAVDYVAVASQPKPAAPREPSRPQALPANEYLADKVSELPQEQIVPLSLEDFKKRGPLPEQGTDMATLRELANQNARSAIGIHEHRKRRESLTGRLLAALLAVVSGVYLLASATELLSFQFLAGCAGALVAAYIVGNTANSLLSGVQPVDARPPQEPSEDSPEGPPKSASSPPTGAAES